MTATTTSDRPSLPASRRSAPARAALVASLTLGPLLMGLSLYAAPHVAAGADTLQESIDALAADPTGAQWSMLAIQLAAIAGVAGSLLVTRVVRLGAPRFGAVAGGIALAGWIVAAYPGPQAAVAASREAGLSREQVAALVDAVDSQLQGVVLAVLFVCLPAGLLLQGVAALIAARVGRCSWPAAALLTASIPVVIGLGLVEMRLLPIGWLVVAAGYVAVGRIGSRT